MPFQNGDWVRYRSRMDGRDPEWFWGRVLERWNVKGQGDYYRIDGAIGWVWQDDVKAGL